jgi:pimeloyl-ACP methyl ester carboxylesterase
VTIAAPEHLPWDSSLRLRSVTLDVGRVAYTEVGDGPPVLLIHGYGDELFTWRHQLRGLRDRWHLYALDLIGYGFSDKPALAYTAELFIECVRQFLRAMGVDCARVVGSSMGAATALSLAKHHPDCVDRLVLLGPTIPGVPPAGRVLSVVFWLAARDWLADWLPEPRFTTPVRLALREAVADPSLVTAEVVRYYADLTRRPGFKHAYLSTARHWRDWAAHRPRLGELKMPALIIWGEEDRIHPFRQAGLLQTLMPQAQLMRLPQCGHLPQVERPEEVNTALQAFLETASQASRASG